MYYTMSDKKYTEITISDYDSDYDTDIYGNCVYNGLFISNSSKNQKAVYSKRSYTIFSQRDQWNILNGRCPDYALKWEPEMNAQFWPSQHDFIHGYKGAPPREVDDATVTILLNDIILTLETLLPQQDEEKKG